MADALISPAVGGVMTAVSAASLGFAVKRMGGNGLSERKIPLMGVLGAFVFAAQMINFTIPGTGSSGHIGGGILLAAILGPFPALLTLASVLLIQCLLFADGGLLAYGCNVFNMGFVSCVLAYSLVFRPLAGRGGPDGGLAGGLVRGKKRLIPAAVISVIVGLQAGALAVVLETVISGVTGLSLGTFLLLMQPIHLAIGLVEGLVTAAVLCYVESLRPELLECAWGDRAVPAALPLKGILVSFLVLAVITGGILSLFASAHPDGLEWSLEGAAGTADFEQAGPVYEAAGAVVEASALMPDYGFPGDEGSALGTATAGIAGSLVTVLLAGGVGLLIHRLRRRAPPSGARAGGAA